MGEVDASGPPCPGHPLCPEATCDRLDCRRLALLISKGLLHPVQVPTPRDEADRQVLRLREQLVRKARSIQQQIKAFLLKHHIAESGRPAHRAERAVEALRRLDVLPELRLCLDVMLDELGHAHGQVKRVTKHLEGLAVAERHRASSGVMRSVPGVGPITAMTFRLEPPEPERFDHAGQVAKMAGPASMSARAARPAARGG
jgi:transposase